MYLNILLLSGSDVRRQNPKFVVFLLSHKASKVQKQTFVLVLIFDGTVILSMNQP